MEETKDTAMMSSSMVRYWNALLRKANAIGPDRPLEVLARMADSEVHILWKDTSPVRTERGLCVVPDLRLSDARHSI